MVERCAKLLADIGEDDLARFLKAFEADTESRASFDHPIWKRWAKVAGTDRPSRELLTEVLAAEGTAKVLDRSGDPLAGHAETPGEPPGLCVQLIGCEVGGPVTSPV
jgi:hypothetical protein